jgi:hypothetical protein
MYEYEQNNDGHEDGALEDMIWRKWLSGSADIRAFTSQNGTDAHTATKTQ